MTEFQMTITVETGEQKIANIYDTIDSFVFNKTFIIYGFEEEPERLYASILNEKENEFSFDAIKDPEEIEYIKAEIERVANEIAKSL